MRSIANPSRRWSLHPSQLWWWLAIVIMGQNLLLNALTQTPEDTLTSLLVWSGAALLVHCDLEDGRFVLRPSKVGMALGWVVLAWVLSRSYLISTRGSGASVLPLVAGLGLALMGFPLRQISAHWRALAALAIAPLSRGLLALLPVQMFAVWTAGFTQAVLLLIDVPTERRDALLTLPGGSVVVEGACTGLPAMLQLSAVAMILALAFPMRHHWQNGLMLILAPLVGFAVNGIRIAILALLNASQLPNKQEWFQLIHAGWAAQLFPALGMLVFLKLYLIWMEHQVRLLDSGYEE